MSIHKPDHQFEASTPLNRQCEQVQWLMSLPPSERLKELVKHYREFDFPPLFNYTHLAPWFSDTSRATLRVLLKRHNERGTHLHSVCRGVFRVTHADLSDHDVLLRAPALIRSPERFYLSMHTAIQIHKDEPVTSVVAAITVGGTNTIKIPDVGAIIFKGTKVPQPKGEDTLTWHERLGCYIANPNLARADIHNHRKGMHRIITQENIDL